MSKYNFMKCANLLCTENCIIKYQRIITCLSCEETMEIFCPNCVGFYENNHQNCPYKYTKKHGELHLYLYKNCKIHSLHIVNPNISIGTFEKQLGYYIKPVVNVVQYDDFSKLNSIFDDGDIFTVEDTLFQKALKLFI